MQRESCKPPVQGVASFRGMTWAARRWWRPGLKAVPNSDEWVFRFEICDLLFVEDQQTTNRSLRQCPIFRAQLTQKLMISRSLSLRRPHGAWLAGAAMRQSAFSSESPAMLTAQTARRVRQMCNTELLLVQQIRAPKFLILWVKLNGWDGRIRTYDTLYQKQLPYHLATSQQ